MEFLLTMKHLTVSEAAELKDLLVENNGVKARFRPSENKARFAPEGMKDGARSSDRR